MPNLTALALDRLLEQGGSRSAADSKMERRSAVPVPPSHAKPAKSDSVSAEAVEVKANRPQMSPALYATPASTPLPDPSTSFPPSPYMVNHKRRGPRLRKSLSEAIAAKDSMADENAVDSSSLSDIEIETKPSSLDVVFAEPNYVEEKEVNGFHGEKIGNGVAFEVNGESKDGPGSNSAERESETEDFYDPQESMSFTSDTGGEEIGGHHSARTSTSMGVFYDACEELSSDGERLQASFNDLQSEIHEIKLCLTMEVDRRKQAEEASSNMQRQWQTLREKLREVGLVLPVELSMNVDSAEDLCQQVRVTRLVAESIGRAAARAECEEEMEAQLESKNFEISRLCDRLHYFETVNREMSQRNQEAIELVRRDRRKTRTVQKLAWSSIFAAITLGSAALAWSYIPNPEGSSSSHQLRPFEPNTTSE